MPFRDRAPRVVRADQGKPGHWFVCEGLEPRSVAGTFAAGKTPEELAAFQLLPSGYFQRQIFATFMDDPVGIANWSFVGRDNFMWASDYPHTLATWPHSRDVIARDFKGVPDDVKSKMVGETGAKLYGLLA